MDDETVRKFLRYYWSDLVDFAIDLARLDDKELEAVELCGKHRMTIEKAAEVAQVPCSVNTMQARWTNARKRLGKVWGKIEWIQLLADTVEE